MKTVHPTLALVALLALSAPARPDEDRAPHRPFLAPRKTGEGRIAFAASNVTLMSWLPTSELSASGGDGADCWGYTSPSGREYAIITTEFGTAWVEVTDPGQPELVVFRNGPSSLWRDVKTYGDNAYVVSEGGSGIQIFDMSNIDAGSVTLVRTLTTGGCTTATHNVVIDEASGFLYRCGGGGSPCSPGLPQGLVIYDLGANPDNPPVVGTYTTRYVHDCQVVVSTRPGALNGHQLAFCAADNSSGGGTANLHILDVTNKASITTVATGAYTSNSFSHQVWLTPDQRYAYLNDELDEQSFGFNTRTRVFDVSNPAAPSFLGFFSSGVGSIDHNLYVHDGKIFEANYRSGLRIFDNTNPTVPSVYGFFDTYEADDLPDFNGLWSSYPFFASGTVIGSDIEKGLFVWRIGTPRLAFAYPNGVAELIGPSGGPVLFEVDPATPGDLVPGSVLFHYSTGGAFTSVGATWLGGDLYEAQLPGASCGDRIDYYVSAQSSDGATWTDPPAAPTQVNIALAAYGQNVTVSNTMESATPAWTVNAAADLTGFATATTGTWVRVNPVGTAAQPEDDHTPAGTFCWVTGQGVVDGGLGDNDIDGGATSLRSPVLDASGLSDPQISYWRWYSNNQNTVIDDVLTVDISNNNGSSWVNVETLGPSDSDSVGGWILHSLRIADFVTPTSTMRLRFRASDLGSGSIVEAGVDDLQVFDLECTALTALSISPAGGPIQGGNVVTITGTGFQAGVTTVRFGTHLSGTVNVLNANTLTAVVPPAQSALFGRAPSALVRDVVVQNPGTGVLPGAYTYGVQKGQR